MYIGSSVFMCMILSAICHGANLGRDIQVCNLHRHVVLSACVPTVVHTLLKYITDISSTWYISQSLLVNVSGRSYALYVCMYFPYPLLHFCFQPLGCCSSCCSCQILHPDHRVPTPKYIRFVTASRYLPTCQPAYLAWLGIFLIRSCFGRCFCLPSAISTDRLLTL